MENKYWQILQDIRDLVTEIEKVDINSSVAKRLIAAHTELFLGHEEITEADIQWARGLAK